MFLFACPIDDAHQPQSSGVGDPAPSPAKPVATRPEPPAQTPLAAALETAQRLEEQLRQAQKMETLGLLAGGIAHDFNNLLTVINGYNDLLLNSFELPEEVRKCIAINRNAGKRAATLVRGLLSFSRRMPLAPVVVDLNTAVGELAALANSFLPANIEFSTELSSPLDRVEADPGGIQQVLLNLVLNSRDAMPEGGALQIRTSNLTLDESLATEHPHVPLGRYVLLTVRDTGIGMDEESQRRLFEPFYTTKPEGAGTGLGLHMVQHIVRQSGGWLAIESDLRNGTAVHLYLPRAANQKAAEEPEAKPALRGGGETILLAEDNGELRQFLRTLLEGLGYTVLDGASARETLLLADDFTGRIDLLVADVALPDSTGSELARQLVQARPGLPVLHISGYAEEAALEPGNEAEFLAKPFTLATFGERVRAMLDRHKRPRVMFVDDDPEVVIFASRVLREAGFEVLVGGNGNVAIETAQTENLDLLITDLVMPEREGLETIMRLKKSHPSLPVIAISGAFGGYFLRGATVLGAAAILAKPFSIDELLQAVKMALGR